MSNINACFHYTAASDSQLCSAIYRYISLTVARNAQRSAAVVEKVLIVWCMSVVVGVVRLPLYPIYSAENVGFRCVETVTPPVASPDGGAASRTRRAAGRDPKRHRLSETWKYKVKQAFSAIIGGNRITRNEEL